MMAPKPKTLVWDMPDGSQLSQIVNPPTVVAPAAPAPPSPPQLAVPASFQPVRAVAVHAKAYDFTQGTLPADWEAIDGTNNGYQATEFMAAQVGHSPQGTLLTAARKTSPTGLPYESAWIDTAKAPLFKYGLFSFTAMQPAGQGLWSGLWGLAPLSTARAEFDAAEMLLGNPHAVYGSAHDWNEYAQQWGETQTDTLQVDLTQGFHDYQVAWQPGMLTWAVDGQAYAQLVASSEKPWPFDTDSLYLIANLAVAAASEWGGAPNAQTVFPASLVLAGVNVWQ